MRSLKWNEVAENLSVGIGIGARMPARWRRHFDGQGIEYMPGATEKYLNRSPESWIHVLE